jgi:hypothetical protein
MGNVNFGLPKKETEYLRTVMLPKTLVEGGTYYGGTAFEQSRLFEIIYTIEKSDIIFEKAKEKIQKIRNIIQLKGDTREHLPKILSKIDNILFWLDAHWSGGNTYGQKDECPILEELEIIFSSPIKNFAILIDDARLFLAPPPLPHNLKSWPTIQQLVKVIPNEFDIIINNDVIFIVPKKINFPKYIQSKITSENNKVTIKSLSTVFFSKISKMLNISKKKL